LSEYDAIMLYTHTHIYIYIYIYIYISITIAVSDRFCAIVTIEPNRSENHSHGLSIDQNQTWVGPRRRGRKWNLDSSRVNNSRATSVTDRSFTKSAHEIYMTRMRFLSHVFYLSDRFERDRASVA